MAEPGGTGVLQLSPVLVLMLLVMFPPAEGSQAGTAAPLLQCDSHRAGPGCRDAT